MTSPSRIAAVVLWLATVGGGIVLTGAWASHQRLFADDSWTIAFAGLLALVAQTFSSSGLLIAFRQPRNLIGWILLLTGPLICVTFSGFALGAVLTAQRGEDDLLAGIAGYVGVVGFFPTVVMFALLTLLFPDGRLPSARWRLPVAIVLFPMALEVGFLAIAPIRNEGLARNPIGIDSELIVAIVPIIDTVANLALLSALVLGLAAVGTRFRHGDAVTRQQLKWFLASLPPFVGLFIISSNEETTQTTVLDVISTASLALLPITICIAILRYRLWEIDRLISRTIGWAAVSAVVLAVFAAGLLALQAVLTDVTQGETLAVAASTLLALATFQPLRRRIQGIVDRRFDRARFDGERVVEGFAGRLRDQFDLDVLVEGLVGVVTETVRPATAVVWLRTHRNERQTLQP